MIGLLGALALSTAPALAAPDPGPRVLEPGTTVRITGLGRRDAFWRFRDDLMGQVCVVDEPGLVRPKKQWYSGPVTCEDEQLYFFQVSVEVGDFGPEMLDVLETMKPPPAPETVATAPPPAPPPSTSAWPIGARVRIRDLSSADAHHAERKALLGRMCTVTDAPLDESGAGWLSGVLRCDVGGELYFYQVALDAESGARPAPTPPSAATGERLRTPDVAAGRLVKVVDLSPSDLHYADRAALLGAVCSVVEAPLLPTGEGWYAGRLFCGQGREWQLYQVAVAAP